MFCGVLGRHSLNFKKFCLEVFEIAMKMMRDFHSVFCHIREMNDRIDIKDIGKPIYKLYIFGVLYDKMRNLPVPKGTD